MHEGTPQGAVLYFVHDPMCSWCWAFRPVWAAIVAGLPAGLRSQRLLGGLAPDSDEPMPLAMQRQIRGYWRRIQQQVPGTRFNYAFWQRCRPRRSTWPACRAVIAARQQGAAFEEPMILAIQTAYYLQARNPSARETLVQLAGEIGLATGRFRRELDSPGVQAALAGEMALGARLGARGFPSLLLVQGNEARLLEYSYRDPDVVLEILRPLFSES
ncbi:MAG TPA: DsbA family protein [Sedimenticola sp.]|nr:DsbA family protein [Sedimenticola sp.]